MYKFYQKCLVEFVRKLSTLRHQGITLVRGASCSLVDIPTYLGPSHNVELGKLCDIDPAVCMARQQQQFKQTQSIRSGSVYKDPSTAGSAIIDRQGSQSVESGQNGGRV